MGKSKFAFGFQMFSVVALSATLLACEGGSEDDGGDFIPPSPDSGITLPPDGGNGADAAPAFTCNPVTQDCADPAQKCTVKLEGNAWGHQCVAPMGTVGEGLLCVRNPEQGAASVGNDNCDKGGYCTAIGNLDGEVDPPSRKCHKFCRGSGDCTTGTQTTCIQLTADINPNEGICIESCDPKQNPTMICTDGAFCEPRSDITGVTKGWCTKGGGLPLNAECGGSINDSCGPNLLCVTNNQTMSSTCQQICDIVGGGQTPAFPCAMGTCQMIGGFPADWGVCGV